MSDLRQQLDKVFTFFKPENLAAQTIKYEGEVALLVIDVQKEYCDPQGSRGTAETAEISKRIQSLAPEFRKAGIPVYAVYFSRKEKKDASEIDFYEFTPQPDDVLVAKNRNSAFEGSNIKELLEKDKKKLLLICGFNLNACVRSTVLDARKAGFEVCLLRDLTGNDNNNSSRWAEDHLADMRDKGVTIEQSEKVLELVHAKKNASTGLSNQLTA